ncbi:hypothetical protein [Hymenobacter sp. B81]|uniref:hypothetical protein n=1 Tax=Hymenobacter sp. B81 TaxID=3344878 RepID=UPI0037DC61AC
MTLPFAIHKVYTSALTKDQLITELERIQPTEGSLQIFDTKQYAAKIISTGFTIKHANPARNLPVMPTIKGKFIQDNPTNIKIRFTPDYLFLLMFLAFSLFINYIILFSDNWNFDGIKRPPTLTERMSALWAGYLPAAMWYWGFVAPVKKAESWLIKRLQLQPLA